MVGEGVLVILAEMDPPRVLRGREAAIEWIRDAAVRMESHIHHIGRTRELADYAWPLPEPVLKTARDGAARGAARLGRPRQAPTVTQVIVIGDWRQKGAKWYSDELTTMRETIEWCEELGQPKVWAWLGGASPPPGW